MHRVRRRSRPPIALTLPPDSGLELVETRFSAPAVPDECPRRRVPSACARRASKSRASRSRSSRRARSHRRRLTDRRANRDRNGKTRGGRSRPPLFLRLSVPTRHEELLIVWHSQFGGTAQMAEAARDGAARPAKCEVVFLRARRPACRRPALVRRAADCDVREFRLAVRNDQGFPRARVLPVRTPVAGKPYSVIVCAGTDGTGAMFQTDRIATGLRSPKCIPASSTRAGSPRSRQLIPADVSRNARKSARRSRRALRPAYSDALRLLVRQLLTSEALARSIRSSTRSKPSGTAIVGIGDFQHPKIRGEIEKQPKALLDGPCGRMSSSSARLIRSIA